MSHCVPTDTNPAHQFELKVVNIFKLEHFSWTYFLYTYYYYEITVKHQYENTVGV